jgi:hypothetical protein
MIIHMEYHSVNSTFPGHSSQGLVGLLNNSTTKILTIHLATRSHIVKRQSSVTAEYAATD